MSGFLDQRFACDESVDRRTLIYYCGLKNISDKIFSLNIPYNDLLETLNLTTRNIDNIVLFTCDFYH